MHPKVSVLMSVHNGQVYLADAIESILNQTFSEYEFLIIDDGSTDRTREIINHYQQLDSRITLIPHDVNIGLTKSLNEALAAAKGEYICRQDYDDISYPERLQYAVDTLEQFENVALVTSHFDVIDLNGVKFQTNEHETDVNLIRWNMLFYNHVSAHSAITFRRNVILEYGGYDEHYKYAQDYDLWLRLLEKWQIISIPKVLFALRIHEMSISSHRQNEQASYANEARRKALKNLGSKVSLDDAELEALRAFWLEKLSTSHSSEHIHKLLGTIYRVFIKKYHPDEMARIKIRRRCAFRFAEAMYRTKNMSERLRLALYAAKWCIRVLLRYLIRKS